MTRFPGVKAAVRRAACLAASLTLAAFLSACATAPATLSTATVAAYRDTIELGGRLSVNYVKDGKPDNLQVNFS